MLGGQNGQELQRTLEGSKSSTLSSDASPHEEVHTLRLALEERQAIIRRHQGESFLLHEQVKHLEQQLAESTRDAQNCFSQLAQVLQIMDGGSGRLPLKAEVDRARALVTSARRSIRRVACGPVADEKGHDAINGARSVGNNPGFASEHRQASTSSANVVVTAAVASSGGGTLARSQTTSNIQDRRASPGGRPRSPRGPVQQQRHGEAPQAGLAASAALAVAEAADPSTDGVTSRQGPGARSQSQARQSAKQDPRSKALAAKPSDRLRSGRGSFGHADRADHDEAVQATPHSFSPTSTLGPSGYVDAASNAATAALSAQLAEVQKHFQNQRDMLLLTLKKGAALDESMITMRDDIIRKDVIIHNLRQEMTSQQQEAKQREQQYEAQLAQLQQQTLQYLQQVRQLQDVQVLLQEQHQLQHIEQDDVVHQMVYQPHVDLARPIPVAAEVPLQHSELGQ